MRMAAVGSVIPNYMAAPHGVGYSDKAVRPQDLGAWETFERMPNWETTWGQSAWNGISQVSVHRPDLSN